MSLSSKVKNRIVDAIHVTFDAIGHKTIMIGESKQNSTMPKSTSNHASLVWEYVVAKDLLSRAEKRRKAAEKELMDAGSHT